MAESEGGSVQPLREILLIIPPREEMEGTRSGQRGGFCGTAQGNHFFSVSCHTEPPSGP